MKVIEYFDGEYLWPQMWGTYYVPMIVLRFHNSSAEILFWDDKAEDYGWRTVPLSSVVIRPTPASITCRQEDSWHAD